MMMSIFDNREFKDYCEFYGISLEQLMDDPKKIEYIKSRQDRLDALINGYSEMGSLNREICQEFAESECEASDLLNNDKN